MPHYMLMMMTVGSVAGAVLAPILLVRKWLENRRTFWVQRVQGQEEAEAEAAAAAVAKPAAGWAGRMDRAFIHMIKQTGLDLNAEQALGVIGLSGVLLAVLLFVWRGEFWLAGLGIAVGSILPLAVFMVLRRRWRLRAQEQLPDVYFLLARSLRAGLSLEQALGVVVEYSSPPLKEEFRRCHEQMKLGIGTAAAVQSMATRVQLNDFDTFVSMVSLYVKNGGNLATMLDRLADAARARNQFRGYFRAATALGRITSFCIGGAVPVMLMVYLLWQPDYLGKFFESTAGMLAFGIAMVLELIGAVWLYLLLRIDY